MNERFTFIIPRQLAGMARPGTWTRLEEDLEELRRAGIGALVSLTEHPVDPDAVRAAGLTPLHLPVADFTPPTPPQIERFVAFAASVIAEGRGVAVHCTAGMGRTGTMLACYLVSLGMDPDEAIDSVRSLRPGSIETFEQEECVHDYARRRAAERQKDGA